MEIDCLPDIHHTIIINDYLNERVICSVLSGQFKEIKIVICKLPLVSMRVTTIQGRFFSFILFFLLLSPAMEIELSHFCMGARWMGLSLLLAVLFITGHWHNTAIFLIKKKLYSIISLTWVFERNEQSVIFIYTEICQASGIILL